jgi:hypothetical protein
MIPMLYKKVLALVILILFVFTTLSGGGCTKKPQENIPAEEIFSTAPITTKVSEDLSNYQNKFTEFQDYSQYLSDISSVNGLICYGNIALLNAGIVIEPKGDPEAAVNYTNMYVIDITSHKVIQIIKYDKENGFKNVFPYGINDNWIVYEQNDDDEFNPNFTFYVIDRKTNKTRKLIERRRENDEFFTKGEVIPKNQGIWIQSPQGILWGDKFYFHIGISLDKVDEKGVLPGISDSIYEVNLNTGDIKKIIHINEKYGGIVSFSVNDHYLAYTFAKRDFEKQMLVEDIYLYSFKDGKITKFTNSGVCERPVLTKDDWIIYQSWLPEALSLDIAVFDKSMGKPAFESVIRPINKETPVFKVVSEGYKTGFFPKCIDVSPSGRFILFDEPYRLLDRETNTLITLKGLPKARLLSFANDTTLVYYWVMEKYNGRDWVNGLWIIDINKLLQFVD